MPNLGIFLTIISLICCFDNHVQAQEQPALLDHEELIECGSEFFPMITPGASVMLVGDSLAVGMESKFISLSRRGGYVPVSHVVTGTSIFQWAKWIKADLEKNKPELVIVSLGTNDAIIYDKVRQYPGLYREFTKIVEDSGAILVWLGPPDISRNRIPHIEETRGLIRKSTTNFFSSEKVEKPSGGDGIHSTIFGYNKWMESAWNWMIDQNILTKLDN